MNSLLKHTKGNKKTASKSDLYDFNRKVEEPEQIETYVNHCSTKHVYWIDDDQGRLNVSHRFVEHVKTLVQAVLDENEQEKQYRDCFRSFDEFYSLFSDEEIYDVFQRLISLARHRQKTCLLDEQFLLEKLVSRHFLSSL